MNTSQSIKAQFEEYFKAEPELLVQSCGRINLIGEHTDYNDGFVLPGAIDKYLFFALRKNKGQKCRIVASDIDKKVEIDLQHIVKGKKLWTNYIAGILQQFQKEDYELEGFDCIFGGNLPIGSGMSSSAALEGGIAFCVNDLFDLGYSRIDLAQLAQQSSHQFVGIQCGIMDQFSSLMGREDHLILLDCQSLDYEYVPFETPGYQLVLLNSKVAHELSSSAYGDRVRECQEGLEILKQHYPKVSSLRDVSIDMLNSRKDVMGEVIYKRCSYVLEENQRVLATCEFLKKGKVEEIGAMMFQTHEGLRHKYEVSCKEIDFLVDFAASYNGVIGARVMGGGFGGCTINLVKKEVVDSFISDTLASYQSQINIKGESYQVVIKDGTNVLYKGF